MTYLLDSDWLIDYLKGRLDAVALLSRLAPAGLALSVITIAEVVDGLRRVANATAQEAALQTALRDLQVLDVDEAVARRFAAIRAELTSIGRAIGDLDTLIAATALHHDLTLVTRNLRHFERIPDLKIHRNP